MSSPAVDGDHPLCGVCLGGFVQPRVLPCGHSFCSTCILQCIRHSIAQNYALSCPMCKKYVGRFQDEDIETFPRNFELEKLMQLYAGIRNRCPQREEWRPPNPQSTTSRFSGTPHGHTREFTEGDSGSDLEEEEQLRLALQMSLQDCGPTVDAELQQEDEDLAQAIYNSQLESNPSLAADGSQFVGVNLKLKNLHPDVTKEQVDQLFSRFGTISSSKVMAMPYGRLKGYGFVCFEDPEAAHQARLEMDGQFLCGRPIKVDLAVAQCRRNTAPCGGYH